MSASKRKEVYLRKHGLSPRTPRESHELSEPLGHELLRTEPPTGGIEECKSPMAAESHEKSWAAKRKEHLLHRAGVARDPAPIDVAATAVHFAAKLKLQAQAAKEAARAKGIKSWQEKRKEAFMATHGGKPTQDLRVAVKTVIFANRLLAKRRDASSAAAALHGVEPLERGPPSSSTSSATGGETSSRGSNRAAGTKSAAEKSWTQRRKETYLKRYGRERPSGPAPADTAVTAVAIAAMLKVRANAAKDRVADARAAAAFAPAAALAPTADEGASAAAASPLELS